MVASSWVRTQNRPTASFWYAAASFEASSAAGGITDH
jgi:hypothetical protein